jgi:ATPase subunit of ABC transporter with duplicated ATPase domains
LTRTHNQLAADKSVFGGFGRNGNDALGGRQIGYSCVCEVNSTSTELTKKEKWKPFRVGEETVYILALMLKGKGANLLLLDEPTNDLDVNTLRALEREYRELWWLCRCYFP